jgi:hypothetical protein
VPPRVRVVHAVEVAGPDVGLLPAFSAPDLEDHVLAVVGIARHEQLAQLAVEPGEDNLLLRDLGAEVLAHLAVGLAVEEVARVARVGLGGDVVTVGVDDRLELRVPSAGFARGSLVARRVDVGEASFELLQLLLQLGQLFEHGRSGYLRPLRETAPVGYVNTAWGRKPEPRIGSASTPSQPSSAVAYT